MSGQHASVTDVSDATSEPAADSAAEQQTNERRRVDASDEHASDEDADISQRVVACVRVVADLHDSSAWGCSVLQPRALKPHGEHH